MPPIIILLFVLFLLTLQMIKLRLGNPMATLAALVGAVGAAK